MEPEPRPCPEHEHCILVPCKAFLCRREVHVKLTGRGRLRQFCSTRCRVAEHRRLA